MEMQAAPIEGHCRGRSNLAETQLASSKEDDIDVFIQVCINSNLLSSEGNN